MGGKGTLIAPVLMIVVGIGWLLTVMQILPGVNWVWILALGTLGLLVLALGGINQVTVVVGPFLILATIFSLMRQTGRLSLDIEVPCLVITAGILLLIARTGPFPPPRWMSEPPKER